MEKKSYAKTILFIIGIIVFCLLLCCWVVYMTQNVHIESFECTGTIGDTIGGLSAPIIGIAGSVLVFVSFQAQIKANKIQFEALNEERIRFESDRWMSAYQARLWDLKKNFKEIELLFPENIRAEESTDLTYKGMYALMVYQVYLDVIYKDDPRIKSTKIKPHIGIFQIELTNILSDLIAIIYSINSKSLIFKNESIELKWQIKEFYQIYLLDFFEHGYTEMPEKDSLKIKFDKYHEIILDCITDIYKTESEFKDFPKIILS